MNTKTIKTNEISLHHVDGIISKDFWCESHHSHDHAEIFIHISGKMKLYIENNVYLHNGNEIRLYAPNELHFGKSDCDQQMEWYQISLASSFLQKYPLLASKILDRQKGLGNVFISRKNTTIVSLLEEIFKKQNSNLLEHYLFSNVIKLLCILNEEDNNIDVQTQTPEALQNILEMLNNNLLSIKTLTH